MLKDPQITTIPPATMKERLVVLEFCFEHHQNYTRKQLSKRAKEKFDRFSYAYYQYLWKRNYLQHDYDGFAMLGTKGGYLLMDYRKWYGSDHLINRKEDA